MILTTFGGAEELKEAKAAARKMYGLDSDNHGRSWVIHDGVSCELIVCRRHGIQVHTTRPLHIPE